MFEAEWKSAVRFRHVARELEPLVRDVHAELLRDPLDLVALRDALEQLLAFIATPEGRSDANCCAVDAFFAGCEEAARRLPEPFRQIVDDMGSTLHDSIYAPKVASTFDSLPEQLLARVRGIEV